MILRMAISGFGGSGLGVYDRMQHHANNYPQGVMDYCTPHKVKKERRR